MVIEFNHQERTLDFALNLFERCPQSKVLDGPAEEQTGQQEGANSPSNIGIEGLATAFGTGCTAEKFDECSVQVRPEGLRVGEKGVEAGDGGCTPEVCGSPAVRLKLGRGFEGEWGGAEDGKHVCHEEASVGYCLSNEKHEGEPYLFLGLRCAYERRHEESPGGIGDGRGCVGEYCRGYQVAEEESTREPVDNGERQLERCGDVWNLGEGVNQRLNSGVEPWNDTRHHERWRKPQ